MQGIKKVLELHERGISQRNIASSLSISRNTVSRIIRKAQENHVHYSTVSYMTEHELESHLFPEKEPVLEYVQPDFDYIHHELLKSGVTLTGLWEEYQAQCRSSKKPPYGRTVFFDKYRDYVKKNNLTMHISHKPGDRMMVDWAGTVMHVQNPDTGEVLEAYLFVATLPFSMYSYVQACPTMKIRDWIDCHVKAYKYFGGSTRLLIPDNLKTGVIKNAKYEDPILNRSYSEMADYYGTTIIPARVRKPQDKAAVEGTVGNVTKAIIGKLRNVQCFSFDQLNKAIMKELEKFNTAEFQKRDGSRFSVFVEEEQQFLQKLPQGTYELSSWLRPMVQLNYHVAIDKMNYSVPYEYVGKRVDAKCSSSTIELYYKDVMIASHSRLYGRKNQYSTDLSHMPENHQLYQWNAKRFRQWASQIGPNTLEVIDQQFSKYKVEEQAYKGCLSILKLADKYTASRLENACQLALMQYSSTGYRNLRLILEAGQDIQEEDKKSEENLTHAILRGSDYYGGKFR